MTSMFTARSCAGTRHASIRGKASLLNDSSDTQRSKDPYPDGSQITDIPGLMNVMSFLQQR